MRLDERPFIFCPIQAVAIGRFVKAGLANSLGFSFGPGIRISSKDFDMSIKPEYKQKFNKGYYSKDLVLSKQLRLSMGVTLK